MTLLSCFKQLEEMFAWAKQDIQVDMQVVCKSFGTLILITDFKSTFSLPVNNSFSLRKNQFSIFTKFSSDHEGLTIILGYTDLIKAHKCKVEFQLYPQAHQNMYLK